MLNLLRIKLKKVKCRMSKVIQFSLEEQKQMRGLLSRINQKLLAGEVKV